MLKAASKPNSFYKKADISTDEYINEYPSESEDIHNKKTVGEFKTKLNELINTWTNISNTVKDQLGFHFDLVNMKEQTETYLNPNRFSEDSPRL
jgi:hypothetical protein